MSRTREELLQDLRDIAQLAIDDEMDNFTVVTYKLYGGKYDHSTFQRRFGSWARACEAAKLPSFRRPQASPCSIACLRCDRVFQSWCRRRNRICPNCIASFADMPSPVRESRMSIPAIFAAEDL